MVAMAAVDSGLKDAVANSSLHGITVGSGPEDVIVGYGQDVAIVSG